MAACEINVDSELLPDILNGPNGLAKLVKTVLNQILEDKVAKSVGAQFNTILHQLKSAYTGMGGMLSISTAYPAQ